MKRRTFLALAALPLLLAACGKQPALPTIPPDARVLAFGDSVTYGTGAAAGEDWPTLLAARTGWQVVNAGIPGDTAQAAAARIQPLLDTHRPQLVIIEIGGNDFLRRRSQRAVKEDIRGIVGAVKSAGAQAVLVAVPALSLFGLAASKASDAPLYEDLAKEEGIALIPDVFSDILSRPELTADKIHPNAHGYQQMATAIHARLQQIGLARK
ncbi:arylesterase [Azoarcus sp. L1K30]|uniref:GDSL-type esterase/lipase family protein n=1 Tax=Azoarcus sp. L1K30 TaxID=2820277 RepID=UPI001B825950|nr:GDSL-type esterase/lipase family protein [Azoarcus sp. L1K30]MBR0567304.1 arylesterase [Azoarcus sp. L1K30]